MKCLYISHILGKLLFKMLRLQFQMFNLYAMCIFKLSLPIVTDTLIMILGHGILIGKKLYFYLLLEYEHVTLNGQLVSSFFFFLFLFFFCFFAQNLLKKQVTRINFNILSWSEGVMMFNIWNSPLLAKKWGKG